MTRKEQTSVHSKIITLLPVGLPVGQTPLFRLGLYARCIDEDEIGVKEFTASKDIRTVRR